MKKIQKTLFILIYIFLVVTAGFSVNKTWTGTISVDWHTSGNWLPSGVPIAGDNVTINTLSNPPKISANAVANSLTISSGSLTITGNTSLILSGNFTHNGGTFSAGPNTTVIFNGSNSTIGGFIPTSFANLTVATSGTVKLDQAITVGGTFTNSGNFNTNQKNVTFNGAVINNGTFETHIPMQPAANSQLTFKQNFNNNGSFTADTRNTAIFKGQNSKITGTGSSETLFGNLTVAANPAKLELEKNIKIAGTFTQDGKFLVNDNTTVTFTGANSKIAGYSEPTFFNLTIASGTLKLDRTTVKIKGTFTNNGTFTHNNKTVIFNGLTSKIAGNTETKFYNLTVDANKILHLEQHIIITAFLENGGIFKAQGKTVTLNPAGTEVKIEGTDTATDTEFDAISCLGAVGKTLTIDGKIMVANLKIGGASEVNKLTVQGGASSEITLSSSNQTPDPGTKKGYYLNVNTNIPITDGKTYYVAESVLGNPNPKNWEHMSSTWKTNATTTNWNTASNWMPEVVPAAGWPVIIPAGGIKYPKLTTNVSAKSVRLNGELDLADYVINDTSNTAPLTNNGLLKMTGTAGSPTNQKDWLESSNTNDLITHITGSKIEYYSNTNNSVWDGPYKNLILGENRAILTANDLKVTGTLTVASTASNLVAINAATQTYDGHINLQKNTTFSSTGANGTMFNGSVSTSGIDIGFSGNGRIQTKDITAKDIIVTAGADTWTSSGTITAQNITVQRTWTSTGNVTANGFITANDWTAKNVSLKGDLTVARFNQIDGTLTFNGTAEQKLKFTGAGNKNIFNLTIDTGAKVKLLSTVTIVRNITNGGTFNADTYTVTLGNNNSHTITGTPYGDDTKKTEFHNLECTGATGKTLTINGKITVKNALKLSGTAANNTDRLIINGTGKISLKTDHSGHTDPSRRFLKIDTRNLEVLENPYVVNQSVDHNNRPKSYNGWIFYKDHTNVSIKNSFAKPGDEYIYLLFSNTSYMSVEEFKFIANNPNISNPKLKIIGGGTPYESDLQNVSPANTAETLWKIKLDKKIKADDILEPSCQIVLNYFGTPKNKAHISDIGIDMVETLTASNSIVLRHFNAYEEDPALPTLDVRVLAEKKAPSSNIKLHFFSKEPPPEYKFWHPDTIPSPPGSFANPQVGTTNYSPTLNGNLMTFIIPSTDPHLKEGKVGQFMYVYDNWLPCARLKDPDDILSFDVWNFNIVGVQIQKGGVSIFDNVVNPHKGQSATIAAHLKKSGMLTIQIMTLDGNIVRTLTRSHHNAGDHFYLWDGRNNGGNPVASGMYFVRIAGPDIDEVRKILIIK